MPESQVVHFYDHEGSRLFLDNGTVIRLRNNPFKSTDEALEPLTRWAKKLQLIRDCDLLASFD